MESFGDGIRIFRATPGYRRQRIIDCQDQFIASALQKIHDLVVATRLREDAVDGSDDIAFANGVAPLGNAAGAQGGDMRRYTYVSKK